jgi:Holliday junction DNA helicase RuvB
LLQLGFLDRTSRGRVATRRAYEHLGRPYRRRDDGTDLQKSLF